MSDGLYAVGTHFRDGLGEVRKIARIVYHDHRVDYDMERDDGAVVRLPAVQVHGFERVCACGCSAPMKEQRSNAIYATRACRTRAYRAKHGIVGYRAVKASQRPKQSGKHAGLFAMWEEMANLAQLLNPAMSRAQALRAAYPYAVKALPQRQREAGRASLEARERRAA